MYWLHKINKTSLTTRFNVTSIHFNEKPFFEEIFEISKMASNTVNVLFPRKGFFYSSCIKFWFVQNCFTIANKKNKFNVKKKE